MSQCYWLMAAYNSSAPAFTDLSPHIILSFLFAFFTGQSTLSEEQYTLCAICSLFLILSEKSWFLSVLCLVAAFTHDISLSKKLQAGSYWVCPVLMLKTEMWSSRSINHPAAAVTSALAFDDKYHQYFTFLLLFLKHKSQHPVVVCSFLTRLHQQN